MGDDPSVAAEEYDARLEYERLCGELDAALVFAAAAEHEFQTGTPDFGSACLADAIGCYTKVLGALAVDNFTAAQLDDLKTRMSKLKHVLDSLRTPMRNEAA